MATASPHAAVEVRLLNGEEVPVSCADCTDIRHLRQRVANALGSPASRLRLLLGTEPLRDDQVLAELPGALGPGILAVAAVVVKSSPVLTGHSDGIIRRWDLSAETRGMCSAPTDCAQGHGGPVLAMSVDWRLGHVLSGAGDWTLRVWTLRPAGRGLDCIGVLSGHNGPVGSVFADFAEQRGFSGSEDGTARLWDIGTMSCLVVFEAHQHHPVYAVAMGMGPEVRWAVTGGRDSRLHVWDLERRRLHGCLAGHGSTILALCMDARGERAVSGARDKRLRVWDIKAMSCTSALVGHEAGVTVVAADFEADRALSGSEDATMRLWDLSSLACLAVVVDWRGAVTALGVSQGLLRAVSGGGDGSLSLWDMGGEGRRLASFHGNVDMGCTHAVSIEDAP